MSVRWEVTYRVGKFEGTRYSKVRLVKHVTTIEIIGEDVTV